MVANQYSVSPTLLGELVSALPSSCGRPPNTSKPLWKRAPWVTEAVETEIRLGTAPKLPTTENKARGTFFWPGRETAIGKASQMPIPSKINFYCLWTFKAVLSQCWTSHSATKHPRLWESCSGCNLQPLQDYNAPSSSVHLCIRRAEGNPAQPGAWDWASCNYVSVRPKHQASQMDRALSTQSIIISKCSNFSRDMLLTARSKITGFFPLIPASLKWTRENAKNLKCGSCPSFCSLTRDYCKLDFFFSQFLLPC